MSKNAGLLSRKNVILYCLLLVLPVPALSAQQPLLFPGPREMKTLDGPGFIINQNTRIIIDSSPSETDQATAAELIDAISKKFNYILTQEAAQAQKPLANMIIIGRPDRNRLLAAALQQGSVEFTPDNPPAQGYIILAQSDVLLLAANDPEGVFYAVQTLISIIESSDSPAIPAQLIRDWPGMKYRELFIEDKWGPDLMTLQDYKDLIDQMARKKLNKLSIAMYGCWNVQYRNEVLEFFMLPLEKYPQLKTPKIIEYYSPQKSAWQRLDYLPTIFVQDYFGDLIKYGQKKHVAVHPKFNSFGHNTLIPRLFPEISAKNKDGTPANYGFCTANDKTYEILFGIFDNIIDKYLKPNNVDWFDLQLDEVYLWCQCDKCRDLPPEKIYLDHLIKLARHLKSKGINNTVVWADMLDSHKMVNDQLVKRFEQEGLKDIIILGWWAYGRNYATVLPELHLRNWVVPMTGYSFPYHYTYAISRLDNVIGMLRTGWKDKVEGATSYSIYDPAYDLTTQAMANFTWRPIPLEQSEAQVKDEYIRDYSRYVFGPQASQAAEVLGSLEKFYPQYHKIMKTILYYTYSYVHAKPYKNKKRPYPEEAFNNLQKIADARTQLQRMALITRGAADFFKFAAEAEGVQQDIARQFYANNFRIANLIDEFILLYDIDDLYQQFKAASDSTVRLKQLEKIKTDLDIINALQTAALAAWETIKPHYLQPQCMRNMSYMLLFCREARDKIDELESQIKNNTLGEIPDTIITGTYKEL